MLTVKQNFLETIRGGKPDRFVKQFEPFHLVFTPIHFHRNDPTPGEIDKVNDWGVTVSWAPGQPGMFPNHRPDLIVCPDIEEWKDYVKAPPTKMPEAAWEKRQAQCDEVDTEQQYVTILQAPGVFEMTHFLCEMSNALAAFYECPDELKELMNYITEWELRVAEETCDHLHPGAILHHDDWGTQRSTFFAPHMFEEFLLEPYKQIYSYYKERGVEVIVHHSDSYAETLVPYMIEVGIDVWQGVMTTNDIPGMIEKYGGQISFMGGINSAEVDYEGWTPEVIAQRVVEACQNGPRHFIPNASQGLDISTFPGVYDEINRQIDAYSPIYWAEHGL
ncbi:MAG: uroporphyrinogen decarboxylase family protein [Coriobacteriales bacterium]|jgi:hypothetical protein